MMSQEQRQKRCAIQDEGDPFHCGVINNGIQVLIVPRGRMIQMMYFDAFGELVNYESRQAPGVEDLQRGIVSGKGRQSLAEFEIKRSMFTSQILYELEVVSQTIYIVPFSIPEFEFYIHLLPPYFQWALDQGPPSKASNNEEDYEAALDEYEVVLRLTREFQDANRYVIDHGKEYWMNENGTIGDS